MAEKEEEIGLHWVMNSWKRYAIVIILGIFAGFLRGLWGVAGVPLMFFALLSNINKDEFRSSTALAMLLSEFVAVVMCLTKKKYFLFFVFVFYFFSFLSFVVFSWQSFKKKKIKKKLLFSGEIDSDRRESIRSRVVRICCHIRRLYCRIVYRFSLFFFVLCCDFWILGCVCFQ